jgi:hypothetical protein
MCTNVSNNVLVDSSAINNIAAVLVVLQLWVLVVPNFDSMALKKSYRREWFDNSVNYERIVELTYMTSFRN